MGTGRVVSSLCACGVVVACAALAIGMGGAGRQRAADTAKPSRAVAAPTSRPATPQGDDTGPASSSTPVRVVVTTAKTSAPTVARITRATTATHATPAAPRPATTHPVARRAVTSHAAPVTHPPSRSVTSHAAPAAPAAPRGSSLPLHYPTYSATKVITVVASHSYSTTARLQAWVRAPGGGWFRSGAEWTAHVGSQGLTSAPSEFKSATPIGSFSLTRAFGRYSDPGTSLPYHHVDSHDYWISHQGSTYNTMQHCTWSGCATGSDEHLIDANPEYNYAAVINYNTTARTYPNGSAFFLHVSDGAATAGCVSVAQDKVVSLLRWLTPSSHPRILIGIA